VVARALQQLGIIAAIPPLCQALLAIPTGLLSDRIGSKKMIVISFAVATLGALLASQAVNPLMFIIAICLVYANTTIYHPASYNYTTKLFTSKDLPKAMGIHGAGGTLGHALGPLLVSILIGLLAFEWRQVYFLLAWPMIMGIAMTIFIKKEDTDLTSEDEAPRENRRERSGFPANVQSSHVSRFFRTQDDGGIDDYHVHCAVFTGR
jgi:MFS family permease